MDNRQQGVGRLSLKNLGPGVHDLWRAKVGLAQSCPQGVWGELRKSTVRQWWK
jgi:hypothetical protein